MILPSKSMVLPSKSMVSLGKSIVLLGKKWFCLLNQWFRLVNKWICSINQWFSRKPLLGEDSVPTETWDAPAPPFLLLTQTQNSFDSVKHPLVLLPMNPIIKYSRLTAGMSQGIPNLTNSHSSLRYPLMSMDSRRYPWMPMDIHGHLWISMDIHIHGYP